ncbi:MAG: hypothetical protein FWD90_04400 [Defluviitaleaceae bacterium]|nr:hypothetical protein [Defluviitaleaceae bacterium]
MANLNRIRWNPAVGLAALLVTYFLAGVLLSFVYAVWMGGMENLIARAVAPVFFGGLLAGAVFGIKRFFKVTLNIIALPVVIAGSAAVYFLMWGEFPLRPDAEIAFILALDEREFPDLITRVIGERALSVIAMRIIGALEAAVIALPPLYTAVRRAGVFLPRYNRWADLRLMDYGFIPFSDRELDKLAAGELEEVFLRKHIDLTGLKRIHAVALCYANKQLTEYLAVFKADWNKRGRIEKGPLLLLAELTVEQIEDLQGLLYEVHREMAD